MGFEPDQVKQYKHISEGFNPEERTYEHDDAVKLPMGPDLRNTCNAGAKAAKKGDEGSRYPEAPVKYQDSPAMPEYFNHLQRLLTK